MKSCPKCDRDKAEYEFGRNAAKPDGLAVWCLSCTRDYGVQYRKDNPEKCREYDRKKVRSPEYCRRKYEAKMRRIHGPDWKPRIFVQMTPEQVRERRRIRLLLKTETRSGRIVPLPCFVCGVSKTEGHHPDYSQPLSVVWLCRKHHNAIHKNKGIAS